MGCLATSLPPLLLLITKPGKFLLSINWMIASNITLNTCYIYQPSLPYQMLSVTQLRSCLWSFQTFSRERRQINSSKSHFPRELDSNYLQQIDVMRTCWYSQWDLFLETIDTEKTEPTSDNVTRNSSFYRKLRLKYRGSASEGNRFIKNFQL